MPQFANWIKSLEFKFMNPKHKAWIDLAGFIFAMLLIAAAVLAMLAWPL